MWIKLSPKDWERVGGALHDACWLWEEFLDVAGCVSRKDKRQSRNYRRIYEVFAKAPIEKKRRRKK